MPVFVLAYVLIYFFAVQWQLLPVQGYEPISAGLWPFARSLILPSVALGVTYMALIARITRASMLEVLQQDYIRTANAKGLAIPSACCCCIATQRNASDADRPP
jgi:peptide/nickel transport system permease protein